LHPALAFHQSDPEILRARVAARGLALIVGVERGRPLVAHTPVLLGGERLRFHLSAQNPLTKVLQTCGRALAVVTGDDAYISPDWYAAADQVPTWNYLSVEIEGGLRVMSRTEAATLLDDLSAHFEARLAPKAPWTRAKMTPARFEAMLGGIVAFEMSVERLEGIAKLSQNKPEAERRRVADALTARPDPGSRAIAARILATP
jgi:transcriptional regulator